MNNENRNKLKNVINTEDILKDLVSSNIQKNKANINYNYNSNIFNNNSLNNLKKQTNVFLPHSSMNFINIKDDSEIEYDHVNKNNIKSDKNYIKKLKENIDTLESDKSQLENEIVELRKKIKNVKKEDPNKKILVLEKEKEEVKKSANHYLHLCSQLAEEVIVLRNQLDKYSHSKKDK